MNKTRQRRKTPRADEMCDLSITDKRDALSSEAMNVIKRVTTQMGIFPVGTFKYKMFKYPGDIDLFEKIEVCCKQTETRLEAAAKIRGISENLRDTDNTLFTDFKAGYDMRYKIYTGVSENEVVDYNEYMVRRDIGNLYDANLLTDYEYEKMINLANDAPTKEELFELNEILRDFWVLRWSMCDLLRGYKVLRGNYKIYLDVALAQGSIVKLDVISFVDDRFVEVTNFFMISSVDRNGKQTVLSEEMGDYKQSILGDVYKYIDTNPLKATKRLWMYLAFMNRTCDMALFKDLFSGEPALIAQVMSDVEVALEILSPGERTTGVYDPVLLIDSLNKRLSLLEDQYIPEPLKVPQDEVETEKLISTLTNAKNMLKEAVDYQTRRWLADRSIDLLSLIDEKTQP